MTPRTKGTKNKRVRSDKGKKHIKTIEQATAPQQAQEEQNAKRDTSADATDTTATGSAIPDTAAE